MLLQTEAETPALRLSSPRAPARGRSRRPSSSPAPRASGCSSSRGSPSLRQWEACSLTECRRRV
jgi:hypothetical protein